MRFVALHISLILGVNVLHSNIYIQMSFVTEFGKTDHIVTIDISRNTDLKAD